MAAKVGFRVAFVAEQVTTVWAPTGIAQAALLLWGRSLWPAIWVGAFIANAGTQAPLWTAASIATGNTLEAVFTAWILSWSVGFDPAFRRTRDGIAFIVFAASLAPIIAATIGIATLCTAGVQPWSRFADLWWAWWLGDALGAIVVAPVILTTARGSIARGRRSWIETAVFVAASVVVTQIVFGESFGSTVGTHPVEYAIVPFMVAAAVRLGQPAAGLVVAGASAVTIWFTVRGMGPFASAQVHESLVLLQVFTGMLACTGLLLSAAITERKIGEQRRAAAHAVGETLAEAATLADAATGILRAICENLGWPLGAIWLVDDDVQRLRCLRVWSNWPSASEFVTVSEGTLFPRSVGLPGRVWATERATWVENIVEDRNFPRAAVARAAGLHGAFAFPICLGQEVLGVIEFFHQSVVSPDPDLLRTLSAVGDQIGQFVARTRVEAAVSEGERRTRAILSTALDAIISMDHDGRITEFNPAAERVFGYTREEAVGRDLADLLIPPELRDSHRAGLRRYLTSRQGRFMDRRIETSACHADGHQFPVEVSITRVVKDDPPSFTGFVRDLSERKEAERERELLLLRELAARHDAEAANRAKDEFLATLSHELRTPLNAIVGWTRMLLHGTVDEEGVQRALEVIDRNAQLQTQIIEDILDVSRIIKGGLHLNVKPVDLGSIIGAALDSVRPAADAKKIGIHARLAAAARLTEGDPQRLQQIVWNLVANAVKFTPAGGTIEIELIGAEEHRVRISVRDNGAGIDPAFLPYVFDRFRQADGSTSREHRGLGLGLAIVRHLVELHGGTVHAESDGLGKGSTFVVELPRAGVERTVTTAH